MEADPKHIGQLLKDMELEGCRGVATPGVRDSYELARLQKCAREEKEDGKIEEIGKAKNLRRYVQQAEVMSLMTPLEQSESEADTMQVEMSTGKAAIAETGNDGGQKKEYTWWKLKTTKKKAKRRRGKQAES